MALLGFVFTAHLTDAQQRASRDLIQIMTRVRSVLPGEAIRGHGLREGGHQPHLQDLILRTNMISRCTFPFLPELRSSGF